MKLPIWIALLSLFPLFFSSSGEWQFKKEDAGIKVYWRESDEHRIREIRITFEVEAGLNAVMAVLKDVDAFPEWIYKCSETRLLSRDSGTLYYSVMDFPWPLTDRDAISYARFEQDPHTKVIRSLNTALPNALERHPDRIRLETMRIQWVITPLTTHRSSIEYQLQTDPGGSLPAWLVNMAIDSGPTKSMKAFRKLTQRASYRSAQVPGVENL